VKAGQPSAKARLATVWASSDRWPETVPANSRKSWLALPVMRARWARKPSAFQGSPYSRTSRTRVSGGGRRFAPDGGAQDAPGRAPSCRARPREPRHAQDVEAVHLVLRADRRRRRDREQQVVEKAVIAQRPQ
jgi:hypothetical protein